MFQAPDNYGISRIEQAEAGTRGWQVRLQRRGVKYAKYFADRRYGGGEPAWEAAKCWRDEVMAQLRSGDESRVCRRSVRNSSGIVGVCQVTVRAANGTEYRFWQAAWSTSDGKRRCVKFSVRRHGERRAFELAVSARQGGVGG